ncbi:MAG TPA: carboxypeptidase regulatory-like domain-containing protein [Thermoanaerobaculia bacterium]|nr:carboxypeptidase regulatory-like domain-containing protein [Thermoanaerobaculia bacterium]
MRRLSLISFVAFLVCSSLFAQSIPTATITGKVIADGSGLPGVTVTVQSPNLQGARTAVTSAAGDYLIPFLPPGDYTVIFELEGMQKVTRKLTLTAARTDRIEIEMRPTAVAESITVTAAAPAAVESTQVTTNFKQDLIENLPVQRNLQSVTLMAPGVNSNGPGGNIEISGAMSFDSLYLVNGAIVNENLRGQPHDLFIEDAIQETTVMTGGISAEYGHFTGGVVSAITKSGGNDLKGSFRTSFSNETWTSKTPFTTAQEDKINPVYEGTLGGPFLRDRLWFFGAGRYAKTSDIRQTVPGLARAGDQDANGNAIPVGGQLTPLTYPHGTTNRRLEGKLTGSITPKHNVILSYIDIDASEKNQTGQVIMDLRSLVPERQTPNTLLAVNYNGALTGSFFVEGQYSKKEFAFLHSGSSFYDIVNGTLITDRARGTRYWSPTFRSTPNGEHRNHTLYTAKGTYFLSTPSFGSHDMKLGYEHFNEVRDVNNYQNGSDYRISISQTIVRGTDVYGRFTGGSTGTATRISWLPILVLSEGSEYASDSIYLNDRWTLSHHWTFNLGARYDKNDAISGDHTFQIAKDSAISPRVAAHYDVFGNGRLIANVSYGQYIGRLAEGVGNDADPAGRNASFQWNYQGPSINNDVNAPTSSLVPTDKAIQQIMDWFVNNGGTNRRPFRTPPSVPGVQSILDPNGLKSPNVKEWTIGVGSALGTKGYARADVLWRNWDDFYTSFVDLGTGKVSDNYGTTYDKAIIRNDSKLYDRKYYAVQSQFNYRLFQRYTIGGTYTWSRLLGNVTGEDSGSGPLTGVAGEYPEYRQASWNYPMGYLTGDQRHRARVWGSYDMNSPVGDFNFSLLQAFDSGTRTSVDGSIDPSPYVKNPGYLTPATSVSYFFGGRGNLKTDNISHTDLAVNYKYRFGAIELFLQPEIINIFNQQGVQSYDEEVLTALDTSALKPFNPFTDKPVECPQGASAATCTSLNANFQRGPNFGKPTSENDYQTPRTYRVSVGVRF